MIRAEILELVKLGAFPASHQVNQKVIEQQDKLLSVIKPPITDEEAKELVKLFGPDDYFGAAWTVLHLVEGAPGWPIRDCLVTEDNQWIILLRDSARRAGKY